MMNIFEPALNQWLKKHTGGELRFFALWLTPSLLVTVVTTLLSIQSSGLFFMFSAAAVFLPILFIFQINKFARNEHKLGKAQFIIIRKSLSYFGLFQFIVHSVNLLNAWSSGSIELPLYYVLYSLAVVSYGLFVPLYRSLNNRENLKRLGMLQLIKKKNKKKYVPVKIFRGIFAEIMSWVDAILWTIVMVIFINSLFFQLYQIPTESMVPEHYVGSRVLAIKPLYNPEVPLSLVRLPVLMGVQRFDQLVLSNPRHELPRDKSLNEFANNVLFMISFSAIQRPKIDVNGEVVVEPLIKRLIGMPGEQVMMVDDKVYIRNSLEEPFARLEEDDRYALNFASDIPVNIERVEQVSVSPAQRQVMQRWDQEKNEVLNNFTIIADDLLDQMRLTLQAALPEIESQLLRELPPSESFGLEQFRFRSFRTVLPDQLLEIAAYALREPESFIDLLSEFLNSADTSKSEEAVEELAFSRSIRGTNQLFKIKMVTALQSLIGELSDTNSTFNEDLRELNLFLEIYIQAYFDSRNFAPFPLNAMLPEGEYFFMGDNRYNSLDGRHWDEERLVSRLMDPEDPTSIIYASRIDPFSFSAEDIRGKAILGVF